MLGLCACKKTQNIAPTYISADFKSYFDYQAGTYWVFYDSLNNVFDSILVTGYTDQQVTNGNISNEEVQIMMGNYNIGASGSVAQWNMFLANNTCSINLENGSYGSATATELVKDYPFRTGTYDFTSNQYNEQVVWTTQLLNSYTIGTATFLNVYMITNSYTYSAYSMDTFYINADNGFIAIMQHDSYASSRLFLNRELIVK